MEPTPMAQVKPCSPHFASPVKEWFDTGHSPIGTFRFRGGRQAPTTRGLIHETPIGRRFIPARPAGFPAPAWRLDASYEWQTDLAWSARRALVGQTSRRLKLLLVSLDMRGHAATLHLLFDSLPTRDDEDQVNAIEAEVTADFVDCCQINSQPLLAWGEGRLRLPSGMVAYRRRAWAE
jgi:hypothetical protein